MGNCRLSQSPSPNHQEANVAIRHSGRSLKDSLTWWSVELATLVNLAVWGCLDVPLEVSKWLGSVGYFTPIYPIYK